MSLKIQQGQLTQGLNIAQAASYATIAAQKHDQDSPISKKMAQLVERLVDMALIELDKSEFEETSEDLPAPSATDTVQ